MWEKKCEKGKADSVFDCLSNLLLATLGALHIHWSVGWLDGQSFDTSIASRLASLLFDIITNYS